MTNLMRTLHRIAATKSRSLGASARVMLVAVAIVALASCRFMVESPEPTYVPGVGYVVLVKGYFLHEKSDMGRRDYFYYVFDTEAGARDFMKQVDADHATLPPHGFRARYSYNQQPTEFSGITKKIEAAKQTPPEVVMPPIDRVVPPVPTGPAPQ